MSKDTYKGNQSIADLKKIIKDITTKKNREIKELLNTISDLEKENSELKLELKEYSKADIIKSSDESTVKQILKYFSKGYTYSIISDKMRYNKMEVDIDYIKEICVNIEDLDNDLILYYKKQVEAYEESIKINPDIIKDTLLQMYNNLINEASIDLQRTTEIEERRKIRDEMKSHGKEVNALLKNIVDDNTDITENEVLSKIAKGLNGTLSNNVKTDFEEFSIDNIEVM